MIDVKIKIMSFYKITDPTERRRMFEKLSQTRKNVQ